MKPQDILTMILNTVYASLFGLSRDAMLAIADKHTRRGMGAGIAYAYGDEDEEMRDCLSEEALLALNVVEGNLAKRLDMFTLVSSPSITAAVKSLERVVKDGCESYIKQHGKIEPIWSE